MAHIFIQHRVADYDRWRQHFDADDATRVAAGVVNIAVLRDVSDPDSVWVVNEADHTIAGPMFEDSELAAKLQAAGVVSEPQVWVA